MSQQQSASTERLSATLLTRLRKEISTFHSSLPPGITLSGDDESADAFNIRLYTAKINGPADTPYAGGVYTVKIEVPVRYPFVPPLCKFVTPVYHPNIDDAGRICCSILSLPPSGTWKPVHNMAAVCTSLYSLLQSPNCDDPLVADIAQQCANNYAEYFAAAKAVNDQQAIEADEDTNHHQPDDLIVDSVLPMTDQSASIDGVRNGSASPNGISNSKTANETAPSSIDLLFDDTTSQQIKRQKLIV